MTEKGDNQVISFFKKERYFLSLVDILFRNENEELYQIFSSIENRAEEIRNDLNPNVINLSNYFIDKNTQIYGKTYIYGGLNFGKMLNYLEHQPRIDVIRGEVGTDNKEKCTNINIFLSFIGINV